MSYKIIVARYNENIDWLSSDLSNFIIYNKGDKLDIENEIFLENVGRESHTYLHYIITNYNNLPDVVVFTQANIADHKGRNDINYLINIKNQALVNSKSKNYMIHYDIGKNIHWDCDWNFKNDPYWSEFNYKNNNQITFLEWFTTHIDLNYPYPIYIYVNAIFAVKKENIINKPIEYYEKLILEVKYHNNPIEAHFFERAWYYIFSTPINDSINHSNNDSINNFSKKKFSFKLNYRYYIFNTPNNESNNESINHSNNDSINHSNNDSITHSNNESITHSNNESINGSINNFSNKKFSFKLNNRSN